MKSIILFYFIILPVKVVPRRIRQLSICSLTGL